MVLSSCVACGHLPLQKAAYSCYLTAVRLKVEQNQLVGVFGEIGVLVDALKGA